MTRGGWGWEDHPEKYPCPRCGSEDTWCMPLDDNHPHYSILKLHHERGATPHDLTRAGYIEYDTVVDGIPTTLWRRPGTQRCTRGAHLEPEPDQPQPGPTHNTTDT